MKAKLNATPGCSDLAQMGDKEPRKLSKPFKLVNVGVHHFLITPLVVPWTLKGSVIVRKK